MKSIRTLAIGLLVLLPLACAQHNPSDGNGDGAVAVSEPEARTFAPAVEGDPMGVVIHKLDNGLTLMLSENHEEPRVTCWISTRTGSHKDPMETTGLAHYLEHMLFKGSTELGTTNWEAEKVHAEAITALYDELFDTRDPAKRTELYAQIDDHNQKASQYIVPNEFDQIYDQWGGRGLNAFTSTDQTSYVIDIPSNRLDSWARLESHRFENPVFRLFQSEIEAVYEEKNRAMDNPGRVINEAFMKALYPEHTYGTQSTLGHTEHLKNPKISAMYDYFHKWYVPGNMVIALAGDFDTAEAVDTIEEHFGGWEAKEVPADPEFATPRPEGRKHVTVEFEGEEMLMLGFVTVPAMHPDADALILCDMMLDNNQTGLINRNISQQQKARMAGSSPMMWTYAGAQTFRGIPRPGQTLEQLEELILEQVELLKKGEFTEQDLADVMTDFEAQTKQGLETNRTRVATMTSAFIQQADWAHEVHNIERLKGVTKEQVVAAANKYFAGDYVSVYRKNGTPEIVKIPKPSFTKVEINTDGHSALYDGLTALEAAPMEPHFVEEGSDYRTLDMRTGKLYWVENPMNDLFQIEFRFPIGTDHDPKLSVAFGILNLAGAGELDLISYRRKLYGTASKIGGGAGQQECVISVSGLDAHLEETLRLMRDHFTAPNGVGEQQLRMAVMNSLRRRQVQKTEARSINGALVSYAQYGAKSPSLTAPTNDELKAYTVEDLLPRVNDVFKLKRKVSYVGTRSPEEIAALLDSLETNTELGAGHEYTPQPYVRTDANRILFVDKKTNQSSVTFIGPAGDYDPTLIPVTLAYNEYMSGSMGSVIFQQVREARSLAYTAWTNFRGPRHKADPFVFTGSVGTQVDKTVEAITLMLHLMHNMPAEQDRFERTIVSNDQRYRTGRIGFRALGGVVQTWENQGHDGDPRDFNWKTILGMTLEDQAAFAATLKDVPMTIAIVGDKSAIDMEALGKLGKIEEMTPDQLFNW